MVTNAGNTTLHMHNNNIFMNAVGQFAKRLTSTELIAKNQNILDMSL